jgi:hypothetical protein
MEGLQRSSIRLFTVCARMRASSSTLPAERRRAKEWHLLRAAPLLHGTLSASRIDKAKRDMDRQAWPGIEK